MNDKWTREMPSLVGKDISCQFRDGAYYRGVIASVECDGDIGAWLYVRIQGRMLSEFFNPGECGRLLEGGTALLVLDVSGVPDREARVFPHRTDWP